MGQLPLSSKFKYNNIYEIVPVVLACIQLNFFHWNSSFGTAYLWKQKYLRLMLIHEKKNLFASNVPCFYLKSAAGDNFQERLISWEWVITQSIPRIDCLLEETGEMMTCSITFRNTFCV